MITKHLRLAVITAVLVAAALYGASFLTRQQVIATGMQMTYILWDVILVIAVITVTIMVTRLIPKKEY